MSRALKTLQGHLAAIQSGEVTKTNVVGLRKAINLTERLAGGWRVVYVSQEPLTDRNYSSLGKAIFYPHTEV